MIILKYQTKKRPGVGGDSECSGHMVYVRTYYTKFSLFIALPFSIGKSSPYQILMPNRLY